MHAARNVNANIFDHVKQMASFKRKLIFLAADLNCQKVGIFVKNYFYLREQKHFYRVGAKSKLKKSVG